MNTKSLSFVISLIFITAFASINSAQGGGYVITDLGSVVESGSITVYPTGINNSQQVTGYVRWDGGSLFSEISPFFYDGSQLHDLSSQIGADSFANGLNDLGHITGISSTVGSGTAYIYDGNNLQDLGTLGGDSSTGYAINNDGEVAGASEINETSSDMHAFYYDGNTMHDIGTLSGAESRAYGMNVFGEIVGRSEIAGPTDAWGDIMYARHAFLYDGSQMIDLGILSGDDRDESSASDINDFGQVTGTSETDDGNSHAFLYENGRMRDLGTLGGASSSGYAINNDGHVVGSSQNLHNIGVAYLYDGNEMLDLCVLTDCTANGWDRLNFAADINNAGCITGAGDVGDESHVFLVTWSEEPIAELCTDGIDNDDDGLIDCDDVEDCGQRIFCYVPPVIAYELIDLGTLGGSESVGRSINNSGQVTGSSETADGASHAFFYDGSTMHDLGVMAATDIDSYGYGINDDGQITGSSAGRDTLGETVDRKVFLYDNGNMLDLHPLFGTISCGNSSGSAINDSGQITGTCSTYIGDMWADWVFEGFLFDGTAITMLHTSGWLSGGADINNNGQVTGYFETLVGTLLVNHAFIYDGVIHDLGTLGGNDSYGSAINDLGQVTGTSWTADDASHAFFYDGSTMHDLGVFDGVNSAGRGINNSGQIVGYRLFADGNRGAFLYDDGEMQDLCSLSACRQNGWSALSYAHDINDRGDITGEGIINNEVHAFLAIAVGAPPPAEICNDGIDNDSDGHTDCADPDCSSDPACSVPPDPEICDDGIDNDGDGKTDCADSDCSSDPACSLPPEPEICNDGIDNDGDGLTDCADPDCSSDPACATSCVPTSNREQNKRCSDGLDNDCDGFIDSADPDCGGGCIITENTEVSCSDGIDNDCDGLVDGADPDCGGSCVPTSRREVNKKCVDGLDNDCDGLIDGDDPDCT